MNNQPLALFIDFVENDVALRVLRKQITHLKDQVVQLRREQQEAVAVLQEAERALKEAQKDVDRQEGILDTLDDRAKKTQKRLDESSSGKEYASLTKELETINQARHAQETPVLTAWRILERLQKNIGAIRKESTEKQAVLHEKITHKEAEAEQIEQDYAERLAKREERALRIPDEWRMQYTRMLESVEDPVAPMLNGACSACSYTVTIQDRLRLERNALVECKGCFRLLYSPERLHAIVAASTI